MRRLVEPLLRFSLIDRSLALGAQAFGAPIPSLIVLETWLWGLGIVLVASAVYGSPQMSWGRTPR